MKKATMMSCRTVNAFGLCLSAVLLMAGGCAAQETGTPETGTPPAGTPAAGALPAGGEVYKNREHFGINLAGIADWSSEMPFIDIFKTSRFWISQKQGEKWGGGPALELNEQGYPVSLIPDGWAETPMLTDSNGNHPTGEYLLLYEGEGEIALNQVGGIVAREPGRIVFTPGNSGFFLQLRRTNPANPVRNIRVYLPGQHDGKTPFYPPFLERVKPFGTLRFMDWGRTNNSSLETWQDRPKVTGSRYTINGVPVEVMVELANTLNANAWFCIPHRADDDFVRHHAQLVKERLQPGLKAYVEYSNEVWNSQFQQTRYAGEKGVELGLGPKERPWEAGWHYYAQRTVEIGRIWKEVFGADTEKRLVIVMASQAANPYVSQQVLGWKDAYKEVDALAIAPYFGGGFGSPKTQDEVARWSVEQLLDKVAEEVRGPNKEMIERQAAVAKQYNLKLIAYEGGQHLVGHGGAENNKQLQDLFIAANRHPRLYDLYQEHLKNWFAAGGDLFTVFSNVGRPSKWGSWGLLEYQEQPVEQAPKYRAVIDFIQNGDVP